jgi:hypothetical protein
MQTELTESKMLRQAIDFDLAVYLNRAISFAGELAGLVPPYWRWLFAGWLAYAMVICWFADDLAVIRITANVHAGNLAVILGAATLFTIVIDRVRRI